jgi:uncharacterized protein
MENETAAAAIVIALRLRDGVDTAFFSWQARVTAAAAAAPGFFSIEFLPVLGSPNEWQMLLQFRDAENLAEWRGSPDRNRLQDEVRCLLEPAAEITEAAAPDLHAQRSVTEVIVTLVTPAMQTAFLDWSARIQQAQAEFPGYRGTLSWTPKMRQLAKVEPCP